MRLKAGVFFVGMLIAVPCARGAESGTPGALRGLREIVARAVEHNGGLEAANARAAQAALSLDAAQRQKYPKLGFDTGFTRSDDPVFAFGALLRQEQFGVENLTIGSLNHPGPTDDFSALVSLGLPLYTGGRLRAGADTARAMSAYAQAGQAAAREQIYYRISTNYIDALYYTALSAQAGEAEAAAGRIIDSAKKLTSRGMLPGAEYYGALALARSLAGRRIAAENGLRTAVARLAILTGSKEGAIALNGALTETPYPAVRREDLLAAAGAQRRDIAMAALQGQAQKKAFSVEKNSVVPDVSAFGMALGNSGDFESMPVKYTVGVKVSMPLFDPAYGPRMKAARERWMESLATERTLKETAAIEVTEACNNYEASQESLAVARDSREQAEASAKMMRSLYREGRVSVLDAVRAEEFLLAARAAAAESAYRMHMSYAALTAAAGQYNDTAVAALSAAVEEETR